VLNTTISFSSDTADYLYADDGITVVGYVYLLAVLTKLDENPFLLRASFNNAADFDLISSVSLQVCID